MPADRELWLWVAFIAIGLATTVPRASFLVLGSRVALPSVLQRALRYAPAAALAAVVMPDLFTTGQGFTLITPKALAAVVAVVLAWRFRNPWLPFAAGMACLWVFREFLPA